MMQFSHRGERVTDFERSLVADAAGESLREMRSLFVDLARRIGIDALAAVLDEFAGEKIHMPTREWFFGALYRQRRDADIARRLANGEPTGDIATRFGVTQRMVQLIGKRNPADDVSPSSVIEQPHG